MPSSPPPTAPAMPSTLERLAGALLILLAVIGVAAAVFVFRRQSASLGGDFSAMDVFLRYSLPALAVSAVLLACALLRRISNVLTLIYLTAVGIAVYGAEFALNYQLFVDAPSNATAEAAERYGVPHDDRPLLAVVRDLRAQGIDAVPPFKSDRGGTELLSLGVAPNRTIVHCNEQGQYHVFASDRYGFNNPDAVWDGPRGGLLIVGDSFAFGACALDNRTFVEILREQIGSPIFNLGVDANGPFLNLAGVVEFAPAVQPRHVIWFHYDGNDFSNMMGRRYQKSLTDYLSPGYRRNLPDAAAEMAKLAQDHFDSVVKPTLDDSGQSTSVIGRMLTHPGNLRRLAKLEQLRVRLGLARYAEDSGGAPDWDLFAQILSRAREAAAAAGADLQLVFLPGHGEETRANAARVAEIAAAAGAGFHDLTELLSKNGYDDYYAYGQGTGHFNQAGNEAIAHWLQAVLLPQLAAHQ